MDNKLKITRLEAVQFYDTVRVMVGSPNYQILRHEVRKKIEIAWPEILIQGVETPEKEVREMTINSREQRSLAEGLVDLLNKKDNLGIYSINTDGFNIIQTVSKICKVWNWVKSKIEAEEVPEFDQPLDDELPLSDEVFPAT